MILYIVLGIIVTLLCYIIYKVVKFVRFCKSLENGSIFINYDKSPFAKKIKSKIIIDDVFYSDKNDLYVTFTFDEGNDGVEDANITMHINDFYEQINKYDYEKS